MRTRHLSGLAALVLLAACALDFDIYRGDTATTSTSVTTSAATGGGGAVGGGGSGATGPTTTTTSAGGVGGVGGIGGNTGGGGAGTAGAGGVAPGCPATRPSAQSACPESGLFCPYDDGATQCECWGGGWSCDTCPTSEPADEDDCDGLQFQRCDYATNQCFCTFGGEWNCGSCPMAAPADQDDCDGLAGLHCAYDNATTECACLIDSWQCQ